MANISQTIKRFKDAGYLSRSEIEPKLNLVKPAIRREALAALPTPSVLINGIGLYSPTVYEPIVAKYCTKQGFNKSAMLFITGAYAPGAKSSVSNKSKPL